MTVKQAVERIQATHEGIGHTEALIQLNLAQSEFNDRTGILISSANLTLTTALSYALPATFERMREVRVLDADDLEITGLLTYEVDGANVVFKVVDGSEMTTMPPTVNAITLYFVAKPTTLTIASSFQVLPQFENAVLARALQYAHERSGDLRSAEYWERQFIDGVRAGKRYARSDRHSL